MVKLSIIIPYYNTLDLTIKLLRELAIQKKEEVEIIIIDDYCKNEFSSIKVASDDVLLKTKATIINHEHNTGVSKSRNDGLDLAKGQYIAFIDSDDMVMPNYIESLLKLIDERNEDIIYFNWLDVNTNEVIRHPSNPAVWKAIYKREILPRFEECYKAKEDYFFNEELDKHEYTKYYYDKVLYIYNSGREDGLTCKNQKGEL